MRRFILFTALMLLSLSCTKKNIDREAMEDKHWLLLYEYVELNVSYEDLKLQFSDLGPLQNLSDQLPFTPISYAVAKQKIVVGGVECFGEYYFVKNLLIRFTVNIQPVSQESGNMMFTEFLDIYQDHFSKSQEVITSSIEMFESHYWYEDEQIINLLKNYSDSSLLINFGFQSR